MSASPVDQIARAVLYEGYILYPYRPSTKNRQRWTFGGVYPKSYIESHKGSDACQIQAQLLLTGEAPSINLTLRFLHLVARTVCKLPEPAADITSLTDFRLDPVESIEIDGQLYHTWQESVERQIVVPSLPIDGLLRQPHASEFNLFSDRQVEPLRNSAGQFVAALVRDKQALCGSIEIAAEPLEKSVWRVTIRVINETTMENAASASRDEALLRSLVSAHVVAGASAGQFVSLMDPEEEHRTLAERCQNQGVWPVLVGNEGQKDTMLCSPIIFYDYPQIAPESAGDLFDSTEIDEILSLRILTLTDEEKKAASALDPRGAALLQRTESLAREQLMGLHGTFRGLRASRREPT